LLPEDDVPPEDDEEDEVEEALLDVELSPLVAFFVGVPFVAAPPDEPARLSVR
jgi:hypothetical protein